MAAATRLQRILHLSKKPQKSMLMVNHEKRAFILNINQATLSPVKSLKAIFDPFHEKCGSIRDVTYSLSSEKLQLTNPKCTLSVDVKSDLSEPRLEVEFNDGEKMVFKTENLNRVEIAQIFKNASLEKAPAETQSVGFQTKSSTTKVKPKKR